MRLLGRFNPRPREGATALVTSPARMGQGFNPRPREGATRVLRDLQEMQEVSIHAPVKGRRYLRSPV